jgi:divalent metal cation (Fe/Co/Zn/Cd) transporter
LGIAYLAMTAGAMFVLARAKTRVSAVLGNHPLVHEARITYLDSMLATAILCALAVNVAFGWWWADPAAAIVVAAAALSEGIITPREH